jgi:hypothetical protein
MIFVTHHTFKNNEKGSLNRKKKKLTLKMSHKILTEAITWTWRPEILEDAIDGQRSKGATQARLDAIRASIKTQPFYVTLLVSRQMFFAVTPWLIKNGEEIAGEHDIKIIVDYLETICFVPEIRMMWIHDRDTARQYIPKILKMAARGLRTISISLCHEEGVSDELISMLADGRTFPYLQSLTLHNDNPMKITSFPSLSDFKAYRAVLLSDTLQNTSNGRAMKNQILQQISRFIRWADQKGVPLYIDWFLTSKEMKNKKKMKKPDAKSTSSNATQQPQPQDAEEDEENWEDVEEEEEDNDKADDNDQVEYDRFGDPIRKSAEVKKTQKEYVESQEISFDLVGIVKYLLNKTRGVDLELWPEAFNVFCGACDVLYNQRLPYGVPVDSDLLDLFKYSNFGSWFFPKIQEFLEVVRADYCSVPPDKKEAMRNNVMNCCRHVSVLGVNLREVRDNIATTQDDFFQLLVDLIDMFNDEPSIELRKKADGAVFQLLGVFLTFVGEDEGDQTTLSRRQHVARLIPPLSLAKCYGVERHPNILLYATKIIHAWRKYEVYTPEQIIRSSELLLEKLKLMLENSTLVPTTVCLLIADILTKTVAFDFSHEPSAQVGNISSFKKWEDDIDWLTRSAKYLEEKGILEAAFTHLRDFNAVKAQDLEDDYTAQAPEIFSFYLIDCLIFADGLKSETESVLNRLREKGAKLKDNWYKEVDQKKCQEICQPNSAVLRIRDKIPDAVQVITRFQKIIPQRFRTYSGERFTACKRAIVGQETWDNDPKNNNKWLTAGSSGDGSGWGSSTAKSTTGFSWGQQTNTSTTNNNTSKGWASASTGWGNANTTWGSSTSSPAASSSTQKKDEEEEVWEDAEEEEEKPKKKKTSSRKKRH